MNPPPVRCLVLSTSCTHRQAYAHALTKVSDEEGIRAFHSLIGSVLDELTLHASYAAKWGIDIHNVSEDGMRGYAGATPRWHATVMGVNVGDNDRKLWAKIIFKTQRNNEAAGS